MEASLFHRCTWSDPYFKDTVFISQHLLRPFIIRNGPWLIQENLKGTQPAFTSSKLTIETLEQGVKYIQS